MNSYGDPQSARARARVPGPSAASTPDDDQSGYDERPAPDAYRRSTGGRASVSGAASVGSASVGSASVGGRASVGSARPPAGSAPVGSARVGGRASAAAPVNAGPGRASVARAAVRPVSPAVGGGPGPDGPGGHGRRGDAEKILTKAAKRRRRTNILTAAAAVVVILLGVGVVGGTYFFDDVDLPPQKEEAQTNVILDAKGTILAKLGDQNRTVVPQAKISKVVQHAVAAAEDKNFYRHNGIDMKGIVRAAWNNFTGGDTQGASTITQQYARHAADLKEISYNRKLREAVIARKLESKYEKDELMAMYLNYIYLGEGRYGIEAAAQGYFGKSVMTPEGSKGAITPYEAAVLASIIKQPEPTATHKGYDPNYNPVDAKDRWEYTMKNMLEEKWITPEVYAARQYPKVKPVSKNNCKTCAADKPVGMIMRHVNFELREMGITEAEFQRGGMTVTTTIDPEVQKAAEEAGSRKSKESPMNGKPKSYQAAVIGIDPGTGRVLGYYAGDDPNGTDYGSYMNGEGTGFSGRGQSPGSTMKIYTLAAGLREGISFETIWDSTKKRANGREINNAGADPGTICGGKKKNCDLETATVKSYNFPFYWIADGIGRDKVVAAARDAGLEHMWPDNGPVVDLTKTDKSTWRKNFDNEVAFGQYHVVPLEHAEGVSTIVNQGVRNKAHFIKSVSSVDPDTGKKKVVKQEKLAPKRVFDKDQMSDLSGVMAKIPAHAENTLRNGRPAIAKSGTWEFDDGKDNHTGSGDTWFVGGIPQLAATVWVGGAGNKVELRDNGGDMFGSGTPAAIWEKFIDSVTKALDWKQEPFPERVRTGDKNSQYANGEAPPPPPENQPPDLNQNCQYFPQFCNNGNGNGNGGPGNGTGNGGPGNGTGNGGPGNGGTNGGGTGDGGGDNLPGGPGNDTGTGGGADNEENNTGG
ncbi:transglycosylase domain-containing protein [Pseudosporangium ferrugineum]|uniref:Membrane peptidoglycan carboxypeptidase n=1 Tax=Pseudosporangium ferrugineum TaxID=439699 RepID=A0A2T0S1B5_9ACTN|nr:transglycosylase domain-containing protein [Pseudosporangium ferrugineum]PRY27217.1 membrane peptidoglycan carboxypeptidase [Pseudosporangium ferrugineum]